MNPRTPTFGRARAALLSALAVGVLPTLTARGEPTWLTDEAIAAELGGKTLEGRYANGRAFTETYGDDGRLHYLEPGATLGGRWSVRAGTLCTIYDTEPTGGCYRVGKVGANCFEFYFVARTEAAAPGPDGLKPSWTAQGSIAGQGRACKDSADV